MLVSVPSCTLFKYNNMGNVLKTCNKFMKHVTSKEKTQGKIELEFYIFYNRSKIVHSVIGVRFRLYGSKQA